MNITEKEVDLVAPNADAAKNGRGLLKKVSGLRQSADGTLIFGECSGSGKNPYYCSADYIDPAAPVFRCSCPSRQIPCKHVLGLMYAFAGGQPFAVADVPEDIQSKRAKIEKRQENQEKKTEEAKATVAEPVKNTKARLHSLSKKAASQLDGVNLADKLLKSIVQMGLSAIDAKTERTLADQVKQLGNYYISGIQTAFNDLFEELHQVQGEHYTRAIARLNYISALLRKSREYLNAKKENPEAIELNSAIEEQIGYAWKLTELLQHGLWEGNAETVQLAFHSYDDPARREWVDEGYWMNLKSGRIYKTKNYRPYKAKNYVKAENSFFDVLQMKELYIYPGDMNPRARWNDAFSVRDITAADVEKVKSYAAGNFAELVKTVKGSIKNPLNDKNPVAVIRVSKAYRAGNHIVVEDAQGNRLTLAEIPYFTDTVVPTLETILPPDADGICMAVMFDNDIQSGLFAARPLSLFTDKIIRLLY
ncbi:MAG: SWIM zinc finger domain-containing protein [Bacteroidales bacterium]|nr:SWIM zinc finger domain-containing protein [Bacteroidales bacterium]